MKKVEPKGKGKRASSSSERGREKTQKPVTMLLSADASPAAVNDRLVRFELIRETLSALDKVIKQEKEVASGKETANTNSRDIPQG